MCVLAVGKMVEAAEEAASLLDARGVHAAVWDVRTIPLDRRMLADGAQLRPRDHRGGRDRRRRGRRGDRVGARRAMESDKRLPTTITLGTPLAFLPHGKPADLLANLGLDGPGIAATVLKALRDLERAGGASRRDQP